MPVKRSKQSKEKSLTKSQVVSELSGATGLPKSQVNDFMTSLTDLIAAELKAGRPITVPGLIKITLQNKPATLARPGRNPFTGENITIKAKPARKAVKVRPIKALKDLA